MKIIVPMAGRGSRFAAVADTNKAYQRPKPLILIQGKPMVVWALSSLKKLNYQSKDLIFICLQEHEDTYQVTQYLHKYFGSECRVILIPEVTRGAVETVMQAKNYVSPEEEVIVSDSDHFFDGTNLVNEIEKGDKEVVGIIPVFTVKDNDAKWSYALTNKDNIALRVEEKSKELADKGAYANIGAYYFRKFKYFMEEAEKSIERNEMYGIEGKKEFFVAPMYQRLIDKGLKVKVAVIPEVWGLGTPGDLEHFLKNYLK